MNGFSEADSLDKSTTEHGLDSSLKAIGRTYFTCDSVSLGLMTMSYFGRVAARSSRASYGFIAREPLEALRNHLQKTTAR